MVQTSLNFMKIPSEQSGYNVWLTRGRSGYMLGQVRKVGRTRGARLWRATINDGRGPNPLSGTSASFTTRRDAAGWLWSLLPEPGLVEPSTTLSQIEELVDQHKTNC